MERLTRADIDNIELVKFENYSVHECLEDIDTVDYLNILGALIKLQDYEDMEEHGELIRLPVNIGDTVYTNYFIKGISPKKGDKIFKVKIIFIGIDNIDNFMNVYYEDGFICKFMFSEIGEKVFLSEEDARLKLEVIDEI